MMIKNNGKAISQAQKIEALEEILLDHPQLDCPVIHHFGPGIYIREVTLTQGTFAIGHRQRYAHLNIILKGAVAIVVDGQLKVLKAPMIYVGQPGRKFGYVLEETIWQNVYATTETDIDVLEATYLDKSDTWQAHDAHLFELQFALCEPDRVDFWKLLKQGGYDAKTVRAQSENETDQIPMPGGFPNITIRQSPIEGKGVFLSAPVKAGELIGPARIGGKRTPLGRYTNHVIQPNARFVLNRSGDIDLIALRDISGCIAGGQGDEVTVNYRDALALSSLEMGEKAK